MLDKAEDNKEATKIYKDIQGYQEMERRKEENHQKKREEYKKMIEEQIKNN